MPLPVPSLDDKTYADLVAEGHALIPRAFPAWTDHNESDPGVTLMELFAFLVESLLYQFDRVPDRTLANMARLVGVVPVPGEPIDRLLARAAGTPSQPTAAVTARDIATLALTGLLAIEPPLAAGLAAGTPVSWVDGAAGPDTRLMAAAPPGAATVAVLPSPDGRVTGSLRFAGPAGPQYAVAGPAVARAHAAPPDGTTDGTTDGTVAGGDEVRLVLVPPGAAGDAPVPSDLLRQQAFELLRARTLLATRIRVVPPAYRPVRLSVTVVRDVRSLLRKDTVQAAVGAALTTFLSPLRGGGAGDGWEFGRAVYRSELYGLLEGVRGVDHIAELLLDGDESVPALPPATDPALAAASLVTVDSLDVTVLDPGSGATP